MTRNQKILGGIAVLLLLWLLLRKKSLAQGSSTSRVLEPNTNIPIGYPGVRGDSAVIGPAILPPNISNDVTNSLTIDALNSGASDLLCPSGSDAIVDPETNSIYCIRSGNPGQNPSPPLEEPSQQFANTFASSRIAEAQNQDFFQPLYYR